jgi:protoheme IX farnesyltransferase
MATIHGTIGPSPTDRFISKLRDYYTLTKPEVNLLILMTTSTGYYLASRGPFRIVGLMNTLVGTLLVASGTATLNQWIERVWDGQMRRTVSRPLPSGRLNAREAFLFGILLSIAGSMYLAVAVNGLTAVLAVSTLLSYLLIYTPLKRKTPLCTLLGAFPGAMPALIGWAGASASIERHAWFLFVVLFLWQFPHFLAIALMYHEDYTRAGYKMLPRFPLHACRNCCLYGDPGSRHDASAGRSRGPGLSEWHVPGGRLLAISRDEIGEIKSDSLGQPRLACLRYLSAYSSWDDCRQEGLKFSFGANLYRQIAGMKLGWN